MPTDPMLLNPWVNVGLPHMRRAHGAIEHQKAPYMAERIWLCLTIFCNGNGEDLLSDAAALREIHLKK